MASLSSYRPRFNARTHVETGERRQVDKFLHLKSSVSFFNNFEHSAWISNNHYSTLSIRSNHTFNFQRLFFAFLSRFDWIAGSSGGSTCKGKISAQIIAWRVFDFSSDLFLTQSSTGKYNARMKSRTDLNLGKVVYVRIIYHIADSWLILLNGYDFYF